MFPVQLKTDYDLPEIMYCIGSQKIFNTYENKIKKTIIKL